MVTPGGRQYRLRATLGKGAFGDVFLAETVGTGIARTVAIKVLHKERASVPGLLARLRDEARMLAMLKHRAIVAVDDFVELEGGWSIVMEYVEGADVAELLAGGPIPPVPALQIAEEICHALHAAYTTAGPDGAPLRLVHRDVKPSNLRVTRHGDVKLLDFGVARADFGDREGATVDAALGTIAYMAPERFSGDDTPAGDVYALGVTLFEMLTGTKPGKEASDPDRAPPGRACAAQWSWLKQASPALQELLARMLSREPGERPTARDTARKLAMIRTTIDGETLEEWAEKRIPPIVTGGIAARRDASTGGVLIERSGSTVTTATTGKKVGLVVAGGAVGVMTIVLVALLGAAAGFGVWYWAEGQPEPSSSAPLTPVPPPEKVAAAPSPSAPAPAPATPAPAAPASDAAPAEVAATPAPMGSGVTEGSPRTEKGTTRTETSKTEAGKTEAGKAEARTEPKTEPRTEPKPEAGDKGTLAVSGDASSITFRGAGGTTRGGSAAPGIWTADVAFASGKTITVSDIQVLAGKTTTLHCSSGFMTCKVRGPS